MTGRETPPATAPEHRTDTAEHGANPAPRGIDAKLAGAPDPRGAADQQPAHQQPAHREAENDRCPEQCAQGDTLCDA